MPMLRPDGSSRLRPPVLLAALALFAAVTLVRFVVEGADEGVTLLYVIPVALLAVELGLAAGLAAAVVASIAFVIWDVAEDAGVGAVGYATRMIGFFAVGALVGALVERLRRAERRVASLAAAEALSSTVLQELTVARLALDRGDAAAGGAAVERALDSARRLLEERLPDDPRPGDFLTSDDPAAR